MLFRSAVGMADATVDPDRIDVAINGTTLCRNGYTAADRTAADLAGRDVTVHIGLNLGASGATILTTDLSHGYVEENSAYSS